MSLLKRLKKLESASSNELYFVSLFPKDGESDEDCALRGGIQKAAFRKMISQENCCFLINSPIGDPETDNGRIWNMGSDSD